MVYLPIHLGVSKNRDIPKSSHLIGISMIFTIHFGGFPTIFGNTHIISLVLVSVICLFGGVTWGHLGKGMYKNLPKSMEKIMPAVNPKPLKFLPIPHIKPRHPEVYEVVMKLACVYTAKDNALFNFFV